MMAALPPPHTEYGPMEEAPSGHPGNERFARMMLRAVYQMSDHAEKLGGATTIAGIAALHALQKSLQSNRSRAAKYLDTHFD